MASLVENINKFTDVVTSWFQNISDVFFTDVAKDVTIKVLDDTGEVVEKTIPNRSKMYSDFTTWKDELNVKNDNGTLKDNADNPLNVESFGGKTLEEWQNENTVPLNRLLINPYTKYSQRGLGNRAVVLQTMDLKNIIITGNNDDGYIITKYTANTSIRGYKTITSPNPGIKLKKVVFSGLDTPILLFEDGKLYGWGHNYSGQLGLGHANSVPYPVFITDNVVDVESANGGDNYNEGSTYVIKSDGSLWVAGNNGNGELGVGDTTGRNTLTLSFDPADHNGEKVIKVQNSGCNGNHAVILTDAGNVYTVGYNNQGQLGTGNTTQQTSWFSPSLNQDHNFIDIGTTVVSNATYNLSTYVISDTGRVFATGDNSEGQLGVGDTTDRNVFTEISYPAGYDKDTDPFVEVQCGYNYAIFRTANGQLYGVGRNDQGNLGLGDTTDRNTLTFITDGIERYWVILSVDDTAAGGLIILKNDGLLYGTGRNSYGFLGIGHNSQVTTFVKVQLSSEIVNDLTEVLVTAGGQPRITVIFMTKQGIGYACGDSYFGQNTLYDTGVDTSNVIPSAFN